MIGGFTLLSESKREWGNIPEDSLKYSEKGKRIYMAVADGVSRDPFNNYPNLNSEKGKRAMAKHYPKPSLARWAADISVESGDLYMANRKIAKLNKLKVPDPNWLREDLAGCTASLAKVEGNTLQYQFVACCGVGIINREGKLKFQTPDEYWTSDKGRWELVRKAEFIKGFAASVSENHNWWSHSEGRFLMRRFFRNKPKQKYSFGVLTGEKEAEEYIRQGEVELNEGDIVLVYSDGLRKPLFSTEGLRLIRERNFSRLEEFCRKQVNNEGTVIYWTK